MALPEQDRTSSMCPSMVHIMQKPCSSPKEGGKEGRQEGSKQASQSGQIYTAMENLQGKKPPNHPTFKLQLQSPLSVLHPLLLPCHCLNSPGAVSCAEASRRNTSLISALKQTLCMETDRRTRPESTQVQKEHILIWQEASRLITSTNQNEIQRTQTQGADKE